MHCSSVECCCGASLQPSTLDFFYILSSLSLVGTCHCYLSLPILLLAQLTLNTVLLVLKSCTLYLCA